MFHFLSLLLAGVRKKSSYKLPRSLYYHRCVCYRSLQFILVIHWHPINSLNYDHLVIFHELPQLNGLIKSIEQFRREKGNTTHLPTFCEHAIRNVLGQFELSVLPISHNFSQTLLQVVLCNSTHVGLMNEFGVLREVV